MAVFTLFARTPATWTRKSVRLWDASSNIRLPLNRLMFSVNNWLPSSTWTCLNPKLKPESSTGSTKSKKATCTVSMISWSYSRPGGRKSPTTSSTATTAASSKVSTTRSKSLSDAAMAFSTSSISSSVSIWTCTAITYSPRPPYMPNSRQLP